MAKVAGAIEAKFKCKLCDKTFQRGPGLGSHMRIVHGVAGMARSTVAARKKDKTQPPAAHKPKAEMTRSEKHQASLGGPIACPECGRICVNKASCANHRRAAHGVKSKAEIERERRAIKVAGSGEIVVVQPASEEKQIEKRKSEPDIAHSQIDPLLFAYSVGEIKERCRSIAEEHGVPTKLFTRQFAELFLREARR